MIYTWTELAWIFFFFSFIGWCAEVCLAVLRQRRFVNRGFLNSPFCTIYGFGAVQFAIFLPELTDNLFFLFLGGALLATVLEYTTGIVLEKIFHKKLWDYSSMRFHIGGYVCLSCSLLWGTFAVLNMLFINPLLGSIVSKIPRPLSLILIWGLGILLILDFLSSAAAVLDMKLQAKRLAQLKRNLRRTSFLLENALTKSIQQRMTKSFPSINMETLTSDFRKSLSSNSAHTTRFAEGLSFYKIVALFFIGAFLGDITETIFCYITTGRLMSRSSVVWGPFSIVWGLGCAFLTLFLYRYRDKNDRYIFLTGTLLGGAYEYICSVFTELVFGTIFWDYSKFTFNLGGRINLLFCFFWGIAAVIWLKIIYPVLSSLIERIPKRFGTIFFNLMIVFMIFNVMISSMALARYTERHTAAETVSSGLQQSVNDFLDSRFPDERMERIYPNAKLVDTQKNRNK